MGSQAAREYANANSAIFEAELAELLAIPSISTLTQHASDCGAAAHWLARLDRGGLEHAEVIQGSGHPLVYADWLHADGAPTVLVYGHYDVQPVDPIDLWTSPPFEATVRDGYLYARGAVDDKGQVAALVDAAVSYLATDGRLPVNLRFLIEGEEESGGDHIRAFVASRDSRLRADFAQVADSGFFSATQPSVCTGLRGCVYTEVTVTGARQDLHSGEFGGVAPNPFISLAHIIAKLRDEQGNITIPGFFDAVAPVDESTSSGWDRLGVTDDSVAAQIGARRLIGNPSLTPLHRMWAQPTLDVHGMPGGFMDPGAKTVIPAIATAKISMRIVPNQTATEVYAQFEHAIQAAAPSDVAVEVRLIHGDDPVLVPSATDEVQAAMAALRTVWGIEPVVDRTGGSIPIVGHFQRALGLPTVLMGYGLPGDNLHAPNERFRLDQFHKGIAANILFWELVAGR